MLKLTFFFTMDGVNFTVETEEFECQQDLDAFVYGTGVEVIKVEEIG